jgi:hypothetical protein
MVEKCRGTMQGQFEQWHQALVSRDGMIGNAHGSAYADLSGLASTQPGGANESLNVSMSTAAPDYGSGRGGGQSARAEAKQGNGGGGGVGMTAQEYASNMAAADSKCDDVNEDILAFYQAKEELLKHRKANQTGRS